MAFSLIRVPVFQNLPDLPAFVCFLIVSFCSAGSSFPQVTAPAIIAIARSNGLFVMIATANHRDKTERDKAIAGNRIARSQEAASKLDCKIGRKVPRNT